MTIKSTNQNILIIVDTLNKGGLAKVELDLAQSWLNKGMTVGLISLDSAQYYDHPKCHYFEFRVDQKITFRWQAIFKRQAIQKWIEQQIRVFEDKFGQANLILGAGELALRTVSKINHPAIVLSSHSSQLQAAKLPGILGQIRLFVKTQRRSFRLKGLLNQKRIHVVSKGLAIELCSVLGVKPKQLTQIYNPFDFAHIRHQSLQLTPQSQQVQQPFIIGIGEFNSRKAFHKLITAFANSAYQGDLILVGQGTEHKNLQNLCRQLRLENRVHFFPFHDNHYALLKKAQLLVMTSESEGLGNVLIEALILGVPVLSTDCPHGPREIVEPFCADALVGLNDISLLSERINRFTQKPYEISETLLERFGEEKILNQYQALFTNSTIHTS